MTKTSHRRGLAAATLALGLTILATHAAAAEPPKQNFGASVKLGGNGYSYGEEGGPGSVQASRTTASSNDGWAQNGMASSSLASGTLRASALMTSSAPCREGPFSNCIPYSLTASATMFDKVTFSKSNGGDIENISLIPTSMTIDGHLAGIGPWARVRSYFGYDPNYNVDAIPWTNLGDGRIEVLDSLFVPMTTTPLYVYIELQTGVGLKSDGFSLSDFGHTLHFNWELPDDMVAHSESGVFMTEVPSAVPEPATWALMITGFGLAGGALRRRRAMIAV